MRETLRERERERESIVVNEIFFFSLNGVIQPLEEGEKDGWLIQEASVKSLDEEAERSKSNSECGVQHVVKSRKQFVEIHHDGLGVFQDSFFLYIQGMCN